MRVQFVYPNTVQHPKDISLGIALLSALLKRLGYEVDLIDTTFGMKDSEILLKIRKFNPDLIALSSISANFSYAVHIATLAKKQFLIPTIIGGIHPTVAPEEAIRKECFDMICIGEGEEALPELVQFLEEGKKEVTIKNIWFKENGVIHRNAVRPFVRELDSLPDADLEIYDYPRYLKNHNRVGGFISGRGCPYQCTYCINHFQQILYRGSGSWVRYRSITNLMTEIKNVIKKYDIKRIEFYDDTFTLDRSRVKAFCEQYVQEVGLPFHINARVDNLSEEMCRDLANGRCRRVQIGVESGDERIRKDFLGRTISDERIIEGCRLIKKYGMELYTFNMIGFPVEKMHHIRKTVELNRLIKPNAMAVSIFTAYKGTKLYETCKERGWLDEAKSMGSYYSSTNIKNPFLSFRKLKCLQRWFGFWVFIGYDPKRALIELIDRNLIRFKSYSKIRTFLITKGLRRSEVDHCLRDPSSPQRGKKEGG